MKKFLKNMSLLILGILSSLIFILILGSIVYSSDITLAVKIALGSPIFGAILVSIYSVYNSWNILIKKQEIQSIENTKSVNDIAEAQLNSPVNSKREDFI